MAEEHPEAIAILLSEHATIDEMVGAARTALSAALRAGDDAAAVGKALERVRDLDAFLAYDLTAHIAKEEDVLFPPLRVLTRDLELVVEDMIVQHDTVKERRTQLQRVLAAIDHDHDDVRAQRADVASRLAESEARPSGDSLESLRNAVVRLHSMLLGHFDDEESNLFPPAEELLPATELAEMVPAMKAIDAATLE